MRKLIPLLCTLCSLLLFAQTQPQAKPRPKVGLVLEGGGALGLAHIGVLQWMEEHRVPVDYIAGTSMGGLAGGFYATGMDVRELRELVTGIDWNGVLGGETEFAYLSFRRKEDRVAYPTAFEFGLRHGLAFPGGFNSGQQVGLILDRIALPYSNLKSFDDLPTPFRCVSTELTERQMHVFQDGPLSDALRATMSIPGFFTPVRLNGKVYVDGGLLDNLPTDVAKEMGAEKIIAVHLETAPLNPETPMSSFTVLGESIATVVATNERRGMKLADTLVRVDLGRFTSISFDQADALIAKGYEAAQQNAEALGQYSLDEPEWQQYRAAREARRIRNMPEPQFVEVTGTSPALAAQLQRNFKNIAGRPLDIPALEKHLTLVTGTGRYSAAGYSLTANHGLLLAVEEKEYAPPTVNTGIVIDGADYRNVRFGIGARFTSLDVGKTGAELRSDVLLGSFYRLAAEYYRPLGDSPHWFVAPSLQASSVPFDLYSRDKILAEYRYQQAYGQLDLGYRLDCDSEFRAGYQFGWLQYDPDIGISSELAPVSGRQGLARLAYKLNRLDDAVVPTRGLALDTHFNYYDSRPGAVDQFPSIDLRTVGFQPLGRPDSLFAVVSGGSTLGYSKTGVPLYSLGGPFRLSAYGPNEILTNQYMLLGAGWLHLLTEGPPIIGSKIYLWTEYEVAKPYAPLLHTSSVPMDGTVGVLFRTLIGPAFIGGSYGDSGHRRIFFQIGRIF